MQTTTRSVQQVQTQKVHIYDYPEFFSARGEKELSAQRICSTENMYDQSSLSNRQDAQMDLHDDPIPAACFNTSAIAQNAEGGSKDFVDEITYTEQRLELIDKEIKALIQQRCLMKVRLEQARSQKQQFLQMNKSCFENDDLTNQIVETQPKDFKGFGQDVICTIRDFQPNQPSIKCLVKKAQQDNILGNRFFDDEGPDLQVQACGFCGIGISISEEDDHWMFNQKENLVTLKSSKCSHLVHKSCLQRAIKSKRAEDGYLNCPSCTAALDDRELKLYVKPQDWKEVELYFTKQLVAQFPNLHMCECGNVIELEQGWIDPNQKDDHGNLLSDEAAEHMATYRVRCNQCEKNFCTKCGVSPYHIGRTCEQIDAVSCRFCLRELKCANQKDGLAFINVCTEYDCQQMIHKFSDKILACGHPSGGIRGENFPLACLEPGCAAKIPNIDKDEYCSICWTTSIGQEPSIQLDCGHIIHHDCIVEQIKKGWNGARIVFNYLDCPQCKAEIRCGQSQELLDALRPQLKFKQIIEDKALKRAQYDNLQKDPKLLQPGNPYNGDLLTFAMATLSYQQCYNCLEAYFVGRRDCAEGVINDPNFNKEDLLCPKCMPENVGGGITNCSIHGTDYIEYKCRYCCNTAIWFCHGDTHYCDPCHKNHVAVRQKAKAGTLPKCPGKGVCPMKMDHPAIPGEEFALGCGLCNEKRSHIKEKFKSNDF